ncbi:FadR/GntR family transcriptional regulator [Oceanicella sp. SM1341]|uniref:FadR/GntR family transcriptional regulator n=1 Tax=Oceanicella sp. SM1341 TaxID=1548889 RepID=UPI000E50EC2F|nr:GntR family transcriptional regulator [Oceanicella sp. SM1341]
MTQRSPGRPAVAFTPVRGGRTFEIVVQQIRDKLASGELGPGDKLPAERDLAQHLNVSRNVVREALRILENAGLLSTRKGAHGGAFIEQGSPALISQAFNDLLTLNAISLDDLLKARELMLGMMLDVVRDLPAAPDLGALRNNLAETEAAVTSGDSPRRVQLAREFYHDVASLTGNSALVFTVDAQTGLVQTFLRYRVQDMDAQQLLQSRRAFLDHLAAGRFEEAKAELGAHLRRVHKHLWRR